MEISNPRDKLPPLSTSNSILPNLTPWPRSEEELAWRAHWDEGRFLYGLSPSARGDSPPQRPRSPHLLSQTSTLSRPLRQPLPMRQPSRPSMRGRMSRLGIGSFLVTGLCPSIASRGFGTCAKGPSIDTSTILPSTIEDLSTPSRCLYPPTRLPETSFLDLSTFPG